MPDPTHPSDRPDRLPLDWPSPIEPLPPADPAPEPPRRTWGRLALPVVAGGAGALAAAAVIAVAGWFGTGEDDPPGERVVERVVTEIVAPEPVAVDTLAAAVARKVVPSIVTVEVSFGGFGGGSGSGVVIDELAGHIVTNEHVVDDERAVTVILSDGRSYEAEVLGTDALTDLAVLHVEADGLTAIELGSTAELEVGDTALAIGNPLGLLGGPSVTVGVMSAFDRSVEGDETESRLWGMIQTDAPFTRGSSGGALVDDHGRLVGITTAVGVSDLGAEGLGFATPVEVVRRVSAEIIASGESRHAYLGIQGRTSFEDRPDGGTAPAGVVISILEDGSAAGASGIEEGDIITTFNGDPVYTMQQLISVLRRFSPEDEVTLGVQRGDEAFEITFTLGERPAELVQ